MMAKINVKRVGPTFAQLDDGTTWPLIQSQEQDSLEHKLRHAPHKLTQSDCCQIASIVHAYEALCWKRRGVARATVTALCDASEQLRSGEKGP